MYNGFTLSKREWITMLATKGTRRTQFANLFLKKIMITDLWLFKRLQDLNEIIRKKSLVKETTIYNHESTIKKKNPRGQKPFCRSYEFAEKNIAFKRIFQIFQYWCIEIWIIRRRWLKTKWSEEIENMFGKTVSAVLQWKNKKQNKAHKIQNSITILLLYVLV